MSLLVEAGIFDEITLNFLIAGHTHSFIDQVFSTFSAIIGKSHFIATPLALRYLLVQCTNAETTLPLVYQPFHFVVKVVICFVLRILVPFITLTLILFFISLPSLDLTTESFFRSTLTQSSNFTMYRIASGSRESMVFA